MDFFAATLGESLRSRWLEWTTYLDLAEHLISSGLIVAIAFAISWATETLISGVCGLAKRRHPGNAPRQKKIQTVRSILHSMVRYSIAFIGLFKILLIWGVPAQSLTVGSAVLASAVGFGSQGLIQDMITGFSLLFEDQLRIGDYVEVNGKKGIVREVGLRVVKIQDLDGAEHTIFNRDITMVSNLPGPPPAATPLANILG